MLNQENLMKMTVIARHGVTKNTSVGFIGGQENFQGAIATTYNHDSHNLIVYSGNDGDAKIAANALISCGGGIVAVNQGKILEILPLPIAGLMGDFASSKNLDKYQSLSDIATHILHLEHREPLSFITLMALAVSPEVKLTDKGLLDVVHKKFLPLIIEEKEDANEQ
jgi:adenine deaminase